VTTGAWLLLVAALLVLQLVVWTAWTLTRLRRLGGRVRRAREVLDAALLRRAELAAALARERVDVLAPSRGPGAGRRGGRLARPVGR
jgi:uncharacterized membrane protein